MNIENQKQQMVVNTHLATQEGGADTGAPILEEAQQA
jgi:hypothetical protein